MIVPAPELPATPPEVTGPFVGRQDNTIIVEIKSMETNGIVTASPADTKSQSRPQVQVVVTGETLIYRETTQPSEPLSAENQTILQTVEQATLNDLDSQAMLIVWGARAGTELLQKC